VAQNVFHDSQDLANNLGKQLSNALVPTDRPKKVTVVSTGSVPFATLQDLIGLCISSLHFFFLRFLSPFPYGSFCSLIVFISSGNGDR
jgi:hypothetical protein